MKGSLLILGAGGHGRVVADAAVEAGYERVAFLDDGLAAAGHSGPFDVIGALSAMEASRGDWDGAIAAVGNNALRLSLLDRLAAAGFALPALIHPSAVISRHARLEPGVFAAASVVVNIGAAIGRGVILNTGCTVDHDCVIREGAHVSPGAHLAGNVTVGRRAWIGIGSALRNNLSVGDDAVVGAGSAVVRDVAPGTTVGGAPARALRRP